MQILHRKTWRNSIKADKCQPVAYVIVQSLQDLVHAVKEAEDKGLKVKVVGRGHSFNNIACTHGYLIDVRQLNHFLPTPDFLKANIKADKHFVNVEAGMHLRDFNMGIDKLGLSVVNMGGIDHQMLAGAASTGTHGSGKDLPAFSGMVRSVLLVSSGGKKFRIERTDGISDPGCYNEPNTTLIHNDDDFNSVIVGLGAFGIIYSLIMETIDMYWLEESKTLHLWDDIKPKLKDGSIFANGVRSVMIQTNPYRVNGQRHCIVVTHKLTHEQPRSFFQRTRNLLSSFFSYIPVVYYFTKFKFYFFPKSSPKVILSALKALEDKVYINKSYKVLYQGVEFIKERAYDAEFAFDMADTASPYWEVPDMLFSSAERFAREGNLYTTSPMGMRFVKAADFFITPEYHRTVCYIDTPFLRGTQGVEDMLEEFQQVMFAAGGIPHWGKKNFKLSSHLDVLPKAYPKLATWKNIRNKYDPYRTFINDYLEEFGLG